MGSVEAPHSYKYQWARHVARENLEADFQLLNEKLSAIRHTPPADDISALVSREAPANRTAGDPPKQDGTFKVGIVGAGCAGLFTAMILDYLKSNVPGINITYDILEAAGKERLGGRLYTHYFSDGPHDYYDIGAMRFPKNDVMARTFKLFKLIGVEGKQIPYYMEDENKVAPSYYNDVHKTGPVSGKDPYQINQGLPDDDKIDESLLDKQPGKVVSDAIAALVDAFKTKLDSKQASGDITSTDAKGGWELLNQADFMSTRQFFRQTDIPGLDIKGPGFNFNTTEWLETFAYATGWYNQALSETVLEEIDFDAKEFFCLEGGTQQVAFAMAKMLSKQPEFNMEVCAIDASDYKKGITTLTIKNKTTKTPAIEKRDYFAVFNSTTLGALQRMDLTKAGLRYGTKQAIRSLAYGASCKVGIKFKSGWWKNKPFNILGGLGKTDLPLRVCVYPSYNLKDTGECVLLCSYTWAQDAQRIGSLISPKSPEDEEDLMELMFHNLALLHAVPEMPYEKLLPFLKEQYITHHAYDWYNDNHMNGAFAYFGPGQFSRMWPEIIKPNKWLFLIGEAASAHHAWIVGALESAVRGVYQMLDMLAIQTPEYKPYQDAMKLLAKPEGEHENLPFGPLPEEMPLNLKGVGKKEEKTDIPQEGVALSFTAAQVILSYLDIVLEQAIAEQKK